MVQLASILVLFSATSAVHSLAPRVAASVLQGDLQKIIGDADEMETVIGAFHPKNGTLEQAMNIVKSAKPVDADIDRLFANLSVTSALGDGEASVILQFLELALDILSDIWDELFQKADGLKMLPGIAKDLCADLTKRRNDIDQLLALFALKVSATFKENVLRGKEELADDSEPVVSKYCIA
ncbi:hypothetical protein C8R43DRAFT_948312 [Mycena crocata]|nr:hypothetical protein C8R43DRAFT_948312 [Mycena crocata]